MTVSIVASVEFEPSELCIKGFVELQDSGVWDRVWAEHLDRYHLKPIYPGAWLVDVAALRMPRCFEIFGCSDRLTADCALTGGYTVYRDGEVVLSPGCCCDLGDIDEWDQALAQAGVHPLAIGHGTVSVRVDGPLVEISDAHEYGGGVERISVNREALVQAFSAARAQRGQFEAGLRQYLAQTGVVDAAHRASVLVGRESPN